MKLKYFRSIFITYLSFWFRKPEINYNWIQQTQIYWKHPNSNINKRITFGFSKPDIALLKQTNQIELKIGFSKPDIALIKQTNQLEKSTQSWIQQKIWSKPTQAVIKTHNIWIQQTWYCTYKAKQPNRT
jgi:hypothetical protein